MTATAPALIVVPRRRRPATAARALAPLLLVPALAGWDGCGGALFSQDPAPDMTGTWDVLYDDVISVEATIGGSVYTAEIGTQGGSFTLEHEGQPLTFALDCTSEDVVCPSEVWAAQVALEQREPDYPYRVWMPVESQGCDGTLVEADAAACGEGTDNPDCEPICDGEVTTEVSDRFGLIGEDGATFALLLGAGVATNGVNCALLGVSVASGDVGTSGSAATGDWMAHTVDGEVRVGYAGACLWADDVDGDDELEAAALGATLVFRTGFAAARAL